jgi:neutral ceramidase
MLCRHVLNLMAFALFAFILTGDAQAGTPTWKAGTTKTAITPQQPLWLAGYAGRDHAAEGTLHDLWIKVLALESPDGQRAVVVTSDLLGFPQSIAQRICQELHAQCGLQRSQIMLTCSHTHSGPVLSGALLDCYPLDDQQRALIAEYSANLEKVVVATTAKALAAMTPATVWAATGKATFAVNRRNNREAEAPKLREAGTPLKGPVDPSVPVMAVRDSDGRLRAIVFGYACHNTTLSGYQWCGDYAGFAQIAVEEKHPEALAMFYMGCGADQNPIPRRSVALAQQYGNMLSAAVEEVLNQPMAPVAPKLQTEYTTIDLPYRPLPPQSELEALAKSSGYRARWAKRMLALAAKAEPLPQSYRYPVQVWKLGGNQLWIALGGEVVVDYALTLKARYGEPTWIAGYANDVMAYIPSRRVWEEGGYEQGAFEVYGMPAQGWTGDVEERILRCVDQLVKQPAQ